MKRPKVKLAITKICKLELIHINALSAVKLSDCKKILSQKDFASYYVCSRLGFYYPLTEAIVHMNYKAVNTYLPKPSQSTVCGVPGVRLSSIVLAL